MALLFSPKKQQSRRVLKRSDPLFSVDGSWSQYKRVVLRDVLGTYPDFSERMY